MNMGILKRCLNGLCVTLCLAFGAQAANAQTNSFTEGNKNIERIGVQGAFFYVRFIEPLSGQCQFDNIYINPDRKAIYAQLLATKILNKRVSRIDYSQAGGPGTMCAADLVELAD